jgi:hypothetical protein
MILQRLDLLLSSLLYGPGAPLSTNVREAKVPAWCDGVGGRGP